MIQLVVPHSDSPVTMQADLTQPNTDTPDNSLAHDSPDPASRKRKGLPTGSRGVASLTPDQLAKKRANDREAQRAIRERTKRTIESLESKIRELEAQQPYQELQAVIRQKNAIQAENEEIRRRLSSIVALIQPIIGAQGLAGAYDPNAGLASLTVEDLASAAHHNAQAGISQNAFPTDPFINGQRPYQTPQGQLPQSENQQYQPYPGDGQPSDHRSWNPSRDLENQRDNMQRGMEMDETGERLSFNMLLESINRSAPNLANHSQPQQHSPDNRSGYPAINQFHEQSQPPPQAPWTALPKNCEPTCPLDNILLNFISVQRRELAEGGGASSASSIATPAYPSVASLLNPTGGHRVDRLSQLMTDVIDKFPNIANLPERVATLFFMFSLTRWMINPTQENYERMPEFLTPRPSQILAPHPAWIDHVPFPRLRDKLVATYKEHPFEMFFMPFTVGLSVNWPYDPTDCLISTSEKEDPIINPVFERHIRRLDNWSVSPLLMENFPDLADTAKVKAVEHRKLD
jgi:hypothetical protein